MLFGANPLVLSLCEAKHFAERATTTGACWVTLLEVTTLHTPDPNVKGYRVVKRQVSPAPQLSVRHTHPASSVLPAHPVQVEDAVRQLPAPEESVRRGPAPDVGVAVRLRVLAQLVAEEGGEEVAARCGRAWALRGLRRRAAQEGVSLLHAGVGRAAGWTQGRSTHWTGRPRVWGRARAGGAGDSSHGNSRTHKRSGYCERTASESAAQGIGHLGHLSHHKTERMGVKHRAATHDLMVS